MQLLALWSAMQDLEQITGTPKRSSSRMVAAPLAPMMHYTTYITTASIMVMKVARKMMMNSGIGLQCAQVVSHRHL
jgi:hypothetical protein